MGETNRLGYLSELVDFRNGKAIAPTDGDVPIYGGNGILGHGKDANYHTCVIIGRVGAYCGSTHLARNHCWVSDNALAGVPKNGSCNEYNYYLLKALKLNERQIGSSQPLLTQGILNSIQVNIEFDTQKQRQIAAVLSALDAKIDLNNRINKELEALAKTIYDHWFVQFDFPDAHGRPYKSSGGAMVWNDTLKREIPEGWMAGTILNVADLAGGGTPAKSNNSYWNGDIPFFTPADASRSVFQLDTEDHVTYQGIDACSSKAFPEGTIFITARGSVGKVVVAGCAMAMNQSCYALCPKSAATLPFVFFHACTLVEHLKVKASGSTFNSIITNDIEWTELVVPLDPVIAAFSVQIGPLFDRIASGQRESGQLILLRKWLLPLLMNGQVRVA